MNISPEEAKRSLREIEASRTAMRSLVRSHRGHLYLWLWGSIWIVVSLLNWIDAPRFWMLTNWISLAGLPATFAIMFFQRRHVRSPVNKRFLWVCVAMLAFSYGVWPVFLGEPRTYKAAYGYYILAWMQLYVVAGIWFDNYWLWVGVAVTALILAGFVFFPAAFWAWSLLGGATLLGTGFYIRLLWR